MIVSRIDRAEYAASVLLGEGAKRFGGRWNPRGVPLIYASSNLALSAQESFVHATIRHVALVASGIELPADVELERPKLARDWRSPEPTDSTIAWGASRRQRRAGGERAERASATRLVAGAREGNVLLNPAAARARKLKVVARLPFEFDLRAWKT